MLCSYLAWQNLFVSQSNLIRKETLDTKQQNYLLNTKKNKGYQLVTLDLCIITRTITSFVLRILLCFFQESSRPSPLPIDFRVSEKELVNQFYNLILGFPGIKLQGAIRRLSPTTEGTHKITLSVKSHAVQFRTYFKHILRSAFIRPTVTTQSHYFFTEYNDR